MAIELKTLDEEVQDLVDTFDSLITPKRVWRNNNNKLYLIFRSIAAGFSKIREIVLSTKYRFDPLYCSDDDLESAMRITGEQRIPAKQSVLRITAFNTDAEESAVLKAGEYSFTSAQGQPFLYTMFTDTVIGPNDFTLLLFVSRDVGKHSVQGEVGARVVRTDSAPISEFFRFEAMENSESLGRPAESFVDIRERILSDTSRQDSIRELELAINALPTIFTCNLIFNPSDAHNAVLEDGTVIEPKKLLIVITGVPGMDLAELVLAKTVYATQMVEQQNMLFYPHELFAGGGYPVYYTYHTKIRFYVTVYYAFSEEKLLQEEVESAFSQMLLPYRSMIKHIPEINEAMLYESLTKTALAGVQLKKVYLQTMKDGQLETAVTIKIPRLSLPELVDITYIGEEL